MICLPEHVRPASRLLRSERSPLYRLALFPLNPILLALLLPPVDDVAERFSCDPATLLSIFLFFFGFFFLFWLFFFIPLLTPWRTRLANRE